ncbi:hypothetical protein AL036_18470 [Salipiger aestuarii]|nr:hypothetical protein AL036_18470 [Salipiger aestuarii]
MLAGLPFAVATMKIGRRPVDGIADVAMVFQVYAPSPHMTVGAAASLVLKTRVQFWRLHALPGLHARLCHLQSDRGDDACRQGRLPAVGGIGPADRAGRAPIGTGYDPACCITLARRPVGAPAWFCGNDEPLQPSGAGA